MLSLLIIVVFLAPFGFLALSSANRVFKSTGLLFFMPSVLSFFLTTLVVFKEQPLVLNLGSSGFGLKYDVLSGLLCFLVLTIGAVVFKYSLRYLEDDPKKNNFLRNLSLTMSFVLIMLLAQDFITLLLAWMSTSYILHLLLVHFSERKFALKAAAQKFWVSRCGDVFLIMASVLIYQVFGVFNFQTMFEMLKDVSFVETQSVAITIISLLIVLGAMTKSAQFPFHFWLPNTMETPTPVSALMHAGIINAGGYLVIRMSPLLIKAEIAMGVLTIVGAFTAVIGAFLMSVQPNIKKSLAYSTISQMGFMMLQCGLGAFSIAVVHIIGHGLYKAYAFLSSGTATDFARLNRYFPKKKSEHNPFLVLLFLILSIGTVFGLLGFMDYNIKDLNTVWLLYFVLALAFSQILLSLSLQIQTDEKQNLYYLFGSLINALSVVGLYIGFSKISIYLLKDIVAGPENIMNSYFLIPIFISGLLFLSLYIFQNFLVQISETKIGKKIYVRALNESL